MLLCGVPGKPGVPWRRAIDDRTRLAVSSHVPHNPMHRRLWSPGRADNFPQQLLTTKPCTTRLTNTIKTPYPSLIITPKLVVLRQTVLTRVSCHVNYVNYVNVMYICLFYTFPLALIHSNRMVNFWVIFYSFRY